MHALWLSAILLTLVALCAAQVTQDTPIPVDREPHHKVVLQNDYVQVLRVTLPAGERTLYHTHSHDRAAIELCTTIISQQKFGEPEGPGAPIKPGDLSVANGDVPYSHRVHNLGPALFEVIDVEFLQRPTHPAEAATIPVAAENPSARAYHWSLAPGAKTPEHTHTRPYLILAATPMKLRMIAPDGQSMTHEVEAGDFHWIDAKVTHTLTNDGSTPGEIIELEMK
jgi:quercetin dioxygenase-like cupin family protein